MILLTKSVLSFMRMMLIHVRFSKTDKNQETQLVGVFIDI